VSNLKSKYLLVNFWGSWCRPCREAHRDLRKVFRTYRYRGFDIYAVALERSLDDWKNTIREDRLIWVNHVSELNYMDSKVARQLGVDAVPFNLLIDENRVVLAKNLTPEQLDAKLAELLSAK
jgi:thiol-disulfide isomerase/thioredoxin